MKTTFVIALSLLTAPVLAQDYPTHPVRLVVSQAAGASIDIQGRLIAQKMSEAWGQSVYVENRPGANGIMN